MGGAGGQAGGASVTINQLASGRVPTGGIVERAVPMGVGQGDTVTYELTEADFRIGTVIVNRATEGYLPATLRAVAARLSAHARVVDLAARVGGEEFGWLMPGTPLQGARAAAERFRSAVAGEGFGPVESLTVSVGVAQLHDADPDGGALFRRADAALYAAKAAGRDRTMAADPA